MKKSNRSILLSLILSFTLSGVALSQIPVAASEIILDKLRLNRIVSGPDAIQYSSIIGDPFMFADFHEGKFVLTDGGSYDLMLRYDIYADEIHVKKNDQVYGLSHPEKMAYVLIDTTKFVYSKIRKNVDTINDEYYFVVATEGKCSLLIKKNIRVQDPEAPKPYQDAKPAKFIPLPDTYYVKLGDEVAIPVKSKKDLLEVLSDRESQINEFISRNKIKTKDIKDLKKVVDYYNSL